MSASAQGRNLFQPFPKSLLARDTEMNKNDPQKLEKEQ